MAYEPCKECGRPCQTVKGYGHCFRCLNAWASEQRWRLRAIERYEKFVTQQRQLAYAEDTAAARKVRDQWQSEIREAKKLLSQSRSLLRDHSRSQPRASTRAAT